jgi:tetratricopeptide (TPR) repeat protein
MQSATLIVSLGALCVASGCAKSKDAQRTTSKDSAVAGALPAGHPSLAPAADLPDAARQTLDSGNVEFRAKRFEKAQRYYEKAAQLAPEHGAPWFGIFMIGDATKNKALADSAMREVQKRTAGTAAPFPDTALRNPHAAVKRS